MYRPFEKVSALQPLLKFENQEPLLVRKEIGRGVVLCLGTSIDRAWTNFPAKPIFSPLMRELIASLADPLREQTSLMGFVDEPFKARLDPGVYQATVVSPDGSSAGALIGKENEMEWPSPKIPGLYQVRTDKKTSDFNFAVNVRNLS